MPIDPSIALQVKAPQFDDIGTIRARGLQLRGLQRADKQAESDLAAQKTIADIYRESVGADGQVDSNRLMQSVASAGLGDRIPGIQKQILADQASRASTRKSGIDADTAQLEQHKKKLDIVNGSLSSLVANQNVTQADVLNQINVMVDQGIITAEEGAKSARALPGRPEALRPYLIQKALEAAEGSKRLDALLPKYDEQDRGGTINAGTIDPLTGTRTAGADVAKSATPGAALTDQRLRDNQSGAAFSPEEGSLMAALAERGISLPAGMRSRAQMKSTFASLLSRNPGMSPDDIAEKIATGQININAERKETMTAAQVAGRVAVAVNELNTFGDLVTQASDAIPRGKFMPINRLVQMSDQQLSDPALINLKVQMQSLNNAYDALAARGGTDADKRAHIAQLFNTATSPEGVRALVAAVKAEAKAAEEAARHATRRRPHETTQAPGPGTGATDVPDDIAALLQKHGGEP